ncbi:MAG TPA: hypothetical protein VMB82_03720, partial [Acidimicrobiales bacterium]|nr:hypothetical protein [Acidimicrobiales bacterium]
MSAGTLAVVAASIVLWALLSARLTRWSITAPIFFVVLGLVTAHGPVTLVHIQLRSSTILGLVEL